MTLSIIIVAWNTKQLLEQCLRSIEQNRGSVDLEVLVVDNASTDGTVASLPPLFPRAQWQLNRTNRGFAAAVNQGIKKSQGNYLLLLNPDTELQPNTLRTMVEFMNQHDDVGIAGCRLLNADGSTQPSVRRFPTLTALLLILTKLAKLLPNLPPIRRYLAADFDYHTAQPVDQVMGAFFLIRRQLVTEVGLFDEQFFIWFEEVDFCRRARNAGWEIWYYPGATVIHYGGKSFRQRSLWRKQYHFYRSAFQYCKKYGFRP